MISRRKLILNASALFAMPALVKCESLEYGLLRGVNIDPKIPAYRIKSGTYWWKSVLVPRYTKGFTETERIKALMKDLSNRLDLEYAFKRISELSEYTYDMPTTLALAAEIQENTHDSKNAR